MQYDGASGRAQSRGQLGRGDKLALRQDATLISEIFELKETNRKLLNVMDLLKKRSIGDKYSQKVAHSTPRKSKH